MKKIGYVVLRLEGNVTQIVKNQVFENKETAEFLKNGLKMFLPKNSQAFFHVMQIELVNDDVDSYINRIA